MGNLSKKQIVLLDDITSSFFNVVVWSCIIFQKYLLSSLLKYFSSGPSLLGPSVREGYSALPGEFSLGHLLCFDHVNWMEGICVTSEQKCLIAPYIFVIALPELGLSPTGPQPWPASPNNGVKPMLHDNDSITRARNRLLCFKPLKFLYSLWLQHYSKWHIHCMYRVKAFQENGTCPFSKESFHFIMPEEISVDTWNLILCSFVFE